MRKREFVGSVHALACSRESSVSLGRARIVTNEIASLVMAFVNMHQSGGGSVVNLY